MSDNRHPKQERHGLTLMTVHAAKGLEFPIVFITGLEEWIFPHHRPILAEEAGKNGPIEEERRLMYVAMTRTQELLWLTHARQRTLFGVPLEPIEGVIPRAP